MGDAKSNVQPEEPYPEEPQPGTVESNLACWYELDQLSLPDMFDKIAEISRQAKIRDKNAEMESLHQESQK